jgi:hypothetical protein
MSLTHQVHKYKSDAATYQQPLRLLRFGSGAPGFFGRGIATFAACYVLSAGGCLQRGGKAEVSSRYRARLEGILRRVGRRERKGGCAVGGLI